MARVKKDRIYEKSVTCPGCGASVRQSDNYCGMCRMPLSEEAKAKRQDIVDQFALLFIESEIKKIDEDLNLIKTMLKGLDNPQFRSKLRELIVNYQSKMTP